jgi:hypothetical protein
MPDRATCDIDGCLSHGFGPLNGDDLAKCLGIAGENPFAARQRPSQNAKTTSQLAPACGLRRHPRSSAAVFEAQVHRL